MVSSSNIIFGSDASQKAEHPATWLPLLARAFSFHSFFLHLYVWCLLCGFCPFICWLPVVAELQSQSRAVGFPKPWSTMCDCAHQFAIDYSVPVAPVNGGEFMWSFWVVSALLSALWGDVSVITLWIHDTAFKACGINLFRLSVGLWAALPIKLHPGSFLRTLCLCFFSVLFFCNCKLTWLWEWH